MPETVMAVKKSYGCGIKTGSQASLVERHETDAIRQELIGGTSPA
jgi:hypothetical protein